MVQEGRAAFRMVKEDGSLYLQAYQESSGTVSLDDNQFEDPVQVAEAMAFQRACARFGLDSYLYHEDES